MKVCFLFLLFCGILSASSPCFEASLGVGVQNDRAYLVGFDNSTGVKQRSIQNGFKNIWSTYGRAGLEMLWGPFQASYQTDLGGGSSGRVQMSLNLSSPVTVPSYFAPVSNVQIWNQVIKCGYAFGIHKSLVVTPLIGWNQYQSQWKIGTSSPSTAPYASNIFGSPSPPTFFSLSEKGSHIRERFSGAFIGGELLFERGCFELAVGYRYSFGRFFNSYELFQFALVVPTLAELSGQASIKSVQSAGEGQLANTRIGYQLTPMVPLS